MKSLAYSFLLCLATISTMQADIIMQDNFNGRSGVLAGSTTSDGKYVWGGWGNAVVANDRAEFPYGSSCKAFIDNTDMVLADFRLDLDYEYTFWSADSGGTMISYRMATAGQTFVDSGTQSGYRLAIWNLGGSEYDFKLQKEVAGVITTIDETTMILADANAAVRIQAEGSSHKIYVDGSLAIDAVDSSTLSAGYWNLTNGNKWGSQSFDNIAYSTIPEPACLSLIMIGSLFVAGCRKKR